MLQHVSFRASVLNMSNALKAKIKQQADFESPAIEAMLNLIVAADAVRTNTNRVLTVYGIKHGQYNVLRILRGAEETGHPRCEIAARMLERAPDITRIIDRLEKQELVMRERTDTDRRYSVTRISRKGLDLLDRIEPELLKVNHRFARKLSAAEWIALTSICEKIYAEQDETI